MTKAELEQPARLVYRNRVNATDLEERRRRLELARQAFKDFYAQCFWSADPHHVVEEQDLPWIIRNLRLHGGHRGYRRVRELCH